MYLGNDYSNPNLDWFGLLHIGMCKMSVVSKKYPRSMHFSFSPGATKDDRIMTEKDLELLVGETLVYTEKLDGSNVCLTEDVVYSRSHGGPASHKSFGPLKKFHGNIKHEIPKGMSVFGEWCYAVHSIEYQMLQHHLSIFGVRDDSTGEWWDWNDVEDIAKFLRVPTVPVILTGAVASKEELQKNIEILTGLSSAYGPHREGVVVRKYDGVFDDGEKLYGLGKWVRANHVQTSVHWRNQPVTIQPSINRI
jgi:hypothetical protein